jgi:hypothetical protein
MQIYNQLFEFLYAEDQGVAKPTGSLKWGTETQRLSPAMVEAIDKPKAVSQIQVPAVANDEEAASPVSCPTICIT